MNFFTRLISARVRQLESTCEAYAGALNKLREELDERREEVENLEIENAALKQAVKTEEGEADTYAKQMHEADQAVGFLHERVIEAKLPLPNGGEVYNFITASLARIINKGGDKGRPRRA